MSNLSLYTMIVNVIVRQGVKIRPLDNTTNVISHISSCTYNFFPIKSVICKRRCFTSMHNSYYQLGSTLLLLSYILLQLLYALDLKVFLIYLYTYTNNHFCIFMGPNDPMISVQGIFFLNIDIFLTIINDMNVC